MFPICFYLFLFSQSVSASCLCLSFCFPNHSMVSDGETIRPQELPQRLCCYVYVSVFPVCFCLCFCSSWIQKCCSFVLSSSMSDLTSFSPGASTVCFNFATLLSLDPDAREYFQPRAHRVAISTPPLFLIIAVLSLTLQIAVKFQSIVDTETTAATACWIFR